MPAQENLSSKTIHNALFSFLGYGLPIIFSIFITPVLVRRLGVENYGIFILVNTINGFLSLSDLGFGMALIKYVAENYSLGKQRELMSLVKTANTVFLGVGLAGMFIYAALAKWFLPFFHINFQSLATANKSFIVFGVFFLLSSLSLSYNHLIRAIQRYDVAVTLNLVQNIAVSVGSLVIVLAGRGLVSIIWFYVGVTAVMLIAGLYYVRKLLPKVSLSFGWDFPEAKKSLRFGFAAFLSNIAGSALLSLDRMIIPLYVGPESLTYYSLPGNVTQKAVGVTGAVSGVLFPLMSSLHSTADLPLLQRVYLKVFRNVTILSVAMTLPMFIFARQILRYWLGEDFAVQGTEILRILAVTYFILSVYGPLINFLLGLGRVKLLAISSMCLAFINVVLLFLLLPHYSIVGAAWAYLLAVLPIVGLFCYVESRILRIRGQWKFYGGMYFKILLNSAVFAILSFFLKRLIVNFMSLVLVGGSSVILFLLIYKILGFFEKEDWDMYVNYLRTIKSKIVLWNL